MFSNNYLRGLVITIVLYFMSSTAALAYTVELSKLQIQEAVQAYFPIEQAMPFATLALYRPMVSLDPKTNRIGLAFSMLVNVPGIAEGKGRGAIDGDLEYRQQTGEFYLHDPKITQLDLQDFPAEFAAPVQQAMQELMRQSMPVILVYKLKDDDIGQVMTRQMLKSVTVRKGKLILELSVIK